MRPTTCFLAMMVLFGMAAFSEDVAPAAEADGGKDLAKESQNPLSTMVSLPFVSGFNFNTGRHNRTQFIEKVQPVYPINLGNWNLINRAIIPLINQPIARDDEEFGLGNINYTAFLSPAKPGKIIWGFGPSITMPTNTDDALGLDEWTAGPSLVVLTMPGNWVLGALAGNQWSIAGDDDRGNINAFSLQYFVNYNIPNGNGWYLKSGPTITADWNADSGDRWTIPVGGGIGRVFKIGKQPVDVSLQGLYNVEKPEDAADWGLEFSFKLLFPRGKKGGK